MAVDGQKPVGPAGGATPGHVAVTAAFEGADVTMHATADPDGARSLLDERPVDCVVTELGFSEQTSAAPFDADGRPAGRAFIHALREWDPTRPVVYTDADLATTHERLGVLLDDRDSHLADVAELAATHGWSVSATGSRSGDARIEVRTD